ncbi:phytanoyl-CoA dioxygenase family protein [Paenibacillus sp. OV219]|uniref:phytanoyl-CoA dioxygenase family protein n=1 Tax=Paenibacillus sp. OV219 TaxID=1884377 RepID=UPI0008B64963|nr:phytanoyl-CoA dioxygenase family protein [Paenibacillus sp. OV219]SEO65230.1 Phytanoyl-CoA dioxygenase (PhyH) [Paenibacillus sp. OV219]
MDNKTLSKEQIEHFIEFGWVKVEEAFPRELALECQQFIWEKLSRFGVERSDRSTWQQPMYNLREAYNGGAFDRCNTERMADAIEDLTGHGRWIDRGVYGKEEVVATWGWWPVNFALGADRPWTVPTSGWHWDGGHFRHYVNSPDQGLLCLCIFSEIRPHGGGTLIIEGSHKVVAKFLEKHPEGLEPQEGIDMLNAEHPYLSELTGLTGTGEDDPDRIKRFMDEWHVDTDGFKLRVAETSASPGDIILCHPFLYHAASQNHSGSPRFMCNQKTPLKERMNFNRESQDDYSPVEISIRQALGRK